MCTNSLFSPSRRRNRNTADFPFEKEQLYFSLPPAHPLSGSKGLYFKDIDGESILLFSQIGFWREVCRQKMPLTRALVQTEQEDFQELVQASALPSFVSNLTMRWSGKPGKPHGDPRIGLRGFCCLSLRVQKRGQKEIIRPDSKNQDGPIARGNTPT